MQQCSKNDSNAPNLKSSRIIALHCNIRTEALALLLFLLHPPQKLTFKQWCDNHRKKQYFNLNQLQWLFSDSGVTRRFQQRPPTEPRRTRTQDAFGNSKSAKSKRFDFQSCTSWQSILERSGTSDAPQTERIKNASCIQEVWELLRVDRLINRLYILHSSRIQIQKNPKHPKSVFKPHV